MNQAEYLRLARKRVMAGEHDGFEHRVATRTPEQRARVQAAYDKFCRQHAEAKQADDMAAHVGHKTL